MKQYYVEVFHPPWPNKGIKFKVMRKYDLDCLSPTLITLFSVQAIDRKDAISKVMLGEAKAIIGGNKSWHGLRMPLWLSTADCIKAVGLDWKIVGSN